MSSLISTVQVSKFSSSEFQEHTKSLYRACFKKLACLDPYFPAYTAPDYSSLGYLPFGDLFYEKVSKFASDGFGQDFTDDISTTCTCAAREVLTNLLDRIRKELKRRHFDLPELTKTLKTIASDTATADRSAIDPKAVPTVRLQCLTRNN